MLVNVCVAFQIPCWRLVGNVAAAQWLQPNMLPQLENRRLTVAVAQHAMLCCVENESEPFLRRFSAGSTVRGHRSRNQADISSKLRSLSGIATQSTLDAFAEVTRKRPQIAPTPQSQTDTLLITARRGIAGP